MAYRLDNKPPSPERFIPRYHVRNGATIQLYFDCFYYLPDDGHDPNYHDFIYWPTWNYHPGDICQIAPPRDVPKGHPPYMYVTEESMVPIDFSDEGYTSYKVVFDNSANITASAARDTTYADMPNTVKMTATVNLPAFTDDPVERNFTVFAQRSGATDAICHGTLVILPGSPYSS